LSAAISAIHVPSCAHELAGVPIETRDASVPCVCQVSMAALVFEARVAKAVVRQPVGYGPVLSIEADVVVVSDSKEPFSNAPAPVQLVITESPLDVKVLLTVDGGERKFEKFVAVTLTV
jgi:hypothetical protein